MTGAGHPRTTAITELAPLGHLTVLGGPFWLYSKGKECPFLTHSQPVGEGLL